MMASGEGSSARRDRWWGGLVLGTIGVLTVAVLVALILWTAAPSYWKRAVQRRQEVPVEQRTATAQHLESHANATITALPRARDDTTRSLVLSFDEINAWLDRRLHLWLESQDIHLPPEIGPVVAAPRDGDLALAFRVQSPHIDQVFSLVFRIVVLSEEQANVRLVKVRGGRLPIPLDLALRELPQGIRNSVPPEALQFIQQVSDGIVFEPVFPIDALRRVRILSIEVTDEQVTLVVRQERV